MKNRHILLFRPDNIGDIVLFSGALKHIRKLYPSAQLTLAVQPHILNLVELCPYVDACISIEQLTWFEKYGIARRRFLNRFGFVVRIFNRACNSILSSFDEIIYPVKSPQIRHLDIVRDLRTRSTVGIVGCTVNAPVGGYSNEINPWNLLSRKFDISSYDPWRHELLTTVDFLNFLGCQTHFVEDIWPEFWLSDKGINPLDGYKREGRKIVGIFPGASSVKRCWKPEKFGLFTRLLKSNVDFAIFGSPSDVALASCVEDHIRREHTGRILNLAGKTTLRELIRAIASCDLFIGTETSGLHIAVANRKKTVGIVGGGHYGRFVPWGDPDINIYLSKNTGCFHCNWDCKYDRTECIQAVLPDEVASVANRLLG